MNITSTLKTLPLVGVIALGLAILPATSIAGDGDRGKHKTQYTTSTGKSHDGRHDKGSHRGDKRKNHNGGYVANSFDRHHYDKRGHKHKPNRHNHTGHVRHNNYHRHGDHGHSHVYTDHSHTNYVIHDHDHRDHYVGLDNLRFMFGLHADNFDIIFRD